KSITGLSCGCQAAARPILLNQVVVQLYPTADHHAPPAASRFSGAERARNRAQFPMERERLAAERERERLAAEREQGGLAAERERLAAERERLAAERERLA